MTSASRVAGAGALAVGAAAVWWRRHPSACPYGQRFWVELPHPFITRARLRDALGPEAGERLLEIGPGTGFYTLPVAEWLGTQGRLDIVDVQQPMIDHTLRAAVQRGVENIVAAQADARTLERRATAAGLRHERSVGNRIGAFHRFARSDDAHSTQVR